MRDSSKSRDDGADRIQTVVGRSLFGVLRALDRRATIRILLTALLIAAICWYFGADVWHSILIGSALTTLGVDRLDRQRPSGFQQQRLAN